MNDQLRTGAVDVDIVLHCLPPSIRDKLKDAGFRSDSDLVGIQPLELASGALDTPWWCLKQGISDE
jgi:hypothetical protein